MLNQRCLFVLSFVVILGLLTACSDDTISYTPGNGDDSDGDTADGDAPDGDAPDGDAPDGDVPDGDAPDCNTRCKPMVGSYCVSGYDARQCRENGAIQERMLQNLGWYEFEIREVGSCQYQMVATALPPDILRTLGPDDSWVMADIEGCDFDKLTVQSHLIGAVIDSWTEGTLTFAASFDIATGEFLWFDDGCGTTFTQAACAPDPDGDLPDGDAPDGDEIDCTERCENFAGTYCGVDYTKADCVRPDIGDEEFFNGLMGISFEIVDRGDCNYDMYAVHVPDDTLADWDRSKPWLMATIEDCDFSMLGIKSPSDERKITGEWEELPLPASYDPETGDFWWMEPGCGVRYRQDGCGEPVDGDMIDGDLVDGDGVDGDLDEDITDGDQDPTLCDNCRDFGGMYCVESTGDSCEFESFEIVVEDQNQCFLHMTACDGRDFGTVFYTCGDFSATVTNENTSCFLDYTAEGDTFGVACNWCGEYTFSKTACAGATSCEAAAQCDDEACPGATLCNAGGQCAMRCSPDFTNQDCPGETSFATWAFGECEPVPCETDADCLGLEICDHPLADCPAAFACTQDGVCARDGACTTKDEPQTDGDSEDDGELGEEEAFNACIDCTQDSDCPIMPYTFRDGSYIEVQTVCAENGLGCVLPDPDSWLPNSCPDDIAYQYQLFTELTGRACVLGGRCSFSYPVGTDICRCECDLRWHCYISWF